MFERTKTINKQTNNTKAMRKVDTRKVLGLLITTILLTSLICYVAFSPDDLSYTTVIQEGSMNSEASYIIFQDASTYYARNGQTGVVTSSTNFSYLLMWSIEETPLGHLIIIKNSDTPYIADTGILIEKPVHIRGEGISYGGLTQGKKGTVIQFDSITNATDIYLFEFYQSDWTKHLYFASIEDICLDANRDENTKSWPLYIHGQVSDLFFEKVWFKEGGYGGIKIRSEVDNEVWNLWFRDCLIENNDGSGFDIQSPDGAHEVNRVHIIDCHFHDNWDDISIWGEDDTTRRRVHDILIRGNTIDATDRHGIKILNASRISIIGNHIMDVGESSADTYSGIFLDDASNVTVVANVIGDYEAATTKYAVEVQGTSESCRIVANILGNCTTAATYEAGTTVDVEFADNTDT